MKKNRYFTLLAAALLPLTTFAGHRGFIGGGRVVNTNPNGSNNPSPSNSTPAQQIQSATTPVAGDGHDWMQSHQDFAKQAESDASEVLFLGDAPIAGFPTTGKDALDKHFPDVKIGNYAIAADRTENLLWRIGQKEFAPLKPKTVVLQIGHANVKDLSPIAAAKGIAAVAAAVTHIFPNAKVVLVSLLPSFDAGEETKITQLNTALRSFDTGGNHRFLNLTPKLMIHDEPNSDLLTADGGLTAAGYETFAQALQDLATKTQAKAPPGKLPVVPSGPALVKPAD